MILVALYCDSQVPCVKDDLVLWLSGVVINRVQGHIFINAFNINMSFPIHRGLWRVCGRSGRARCSLGSQQVSDGAGLPACTNVPCQRTILFESRPTSLSYSTKRGSLQTACRRISAIEVDLLAMPAPPLGQQKRSKMRRGGYCIKDRTVGCTGKGWWMTSSEWGFPSP